MRFPPNGVSCDIQNWQDIAIAVLPGRLESRRLASVPEFQFLRFRYPRSPIAKGRFAAGKVGFQGLRAGGNEALRNCFGPPQQYGHQRRDVPSSRIAAALEDACSR